MARIKEQMAHMDKMMENLTNMIQDSTVAVAATTVTPTPTVGEGNQEITPQEHPHIRTTNQSSFSTTPRVQATSFTQGLVLEERVPRPITGAVIGAIPGEHEETLVPKTSQTYQMGASDYEHEEKAPEWKKEVEKLASDVTPRVRAPAQRSE